VVIPAGERWPDGSLRPALEDLLGAGSIISFLSGKKSPEALLAQSSFQALRHDLLGNLMQCASGLELREKGREQDVEIAAEINVSNLRPCLLTVLLSIIASGAPNTGRPALSVFPSPKPNPAPGRLRRRHQFTNGIKDNLKLRVILLFQCRKFPGEFSMRGQNLPQPDKCSDDLNINRNGSLAVQHRRQHHDAVFGIGIRQLSAAAAPIKGETSEAKIFRGFARFRV